MGYASWQILRSSYWCSCFTYIGSTYGECTGLQNNLVLR